MPSGPMRDLVRRPLRLALAVLLIGAAGCGGSDTARPTPTAAPTAIATATAAAPATPTASLAPTDVPTSNPTATPTVPPPATPTTSPAVVGGPLAMRRLTTAQYKATIADVLGGDIVVAGRIEPDNRRSGLLAVGSTYVSVTGAGFEQYEAIARTVSEQALDPAHRGALLSCQPQTATDDACAGQFIRTIGRRLLRRPLSDDEVAAHVALAGAAGAALGDFYDGLETALTGLLLSPEFLFRVETAAPDPQVPQRQRLSDATMASRLSYLLWNTAPDTELLDAAERGELTDDAGLARQVDRLLASPRLEAAVRAFFSDLFGFDEIEDGLVRKDPALFPAFSQALINDAREQTLRVIADHLLASDGDYRELYTTRRSFMTRALGVVYQVPVRTADGWEAFQFPADSARAGLLTHVSLLALRSHPGRSSPTLRGKFVREVLLCTDVPPPPGDIDFSMFAEEGGENRRTARERLTVHETNEVCAGCHSLMDPIGLGLEQMDGIGAYRETENGAAIDPSGELNGVRFADAADLGEVLSRDPGLGPCFVESLYRYAVGRDIDPGELTWLAGVEVDADASGYRWRDLLRTIAMSDAFRTTSGARNAEEPTVTPSPGGTSAPSPTAPTRTPTIGDPNATPSTSPPPNPTVTPVGVTFQQLQDEIFSPRCATQYCHSATAKSGNLVLESGQAHDNLVGIQPNLAAARNAGFLRVDPTSPDNSFLIFKLTQPTSAMFGSRMPLVGSPLSEAEIDAIREWILAGAQP
jgi:Protein of unknown function (DUF1592)/Protein of unknown function (DUF1588)/Protein of unknown function (DUF1595)/Protein of unknown function (DUF1585)/Protein of unknown function (DUF1587)